MKSRDDDRATVRRTHQTFAARTLLGEGNRLIASLGPEDRSALIEAARPFDFPLGHVFCEAGDRPTHVEFIERGVVSAIATLKDGRSIESHMIGREGATHPLTYANADICYTRLVAQMPGSGRRIEIARLKALVADRPQIAETLTAYAVRLMHELEYSAACNAMHRADQRFAKWLLRCHDRADGDVLALTQEVLASMLGAQRTTVNEAAQHLQRAGAIRYARGAIHILDRTALERAACECYGVERARLDITAPDPS